MKVLIINICLRPNSEKIIFPIGLGYIATAIERAGFDFEILDLDALRLLDEEIEQFIKKTDFDVVALGCIVTGYRFVKKIAETIKKHKDVPIIAGNSVATSIPEILLNKTKVDIGVMGEGDITIVELLKAIENKTPLEKVKGIFFEKEGRVVFTEPREPIANLDELPFINYELFDMKTYLAKCKFNVSEPYPMNFDLLKAFPVNTARGCCFNCTFCYHVFKKNRYRTRSIENVGREIKGLQRKYGVNYIQFFDELTLFSKEQANKFADYFLKEDLKVFWAADCRAGLFGENDLPLALKLKRAGCVSLGYSLESADEEILKAMRKHITPEQFEIQTKVLQKAGIYPASGLVIGYPQETEQTLKKTFDCCYNCDIYPSAGYLLPQPGTPMYDYAIQTGKIQDEEEYLLKMGDRQDFTINLTNMPQARMEQLVTTYLKRIAQKLNLGIDKDHLIKTGHYKQKEHYGKTKQIEVWESEFGKEYTDRNVSDPQIRVQPFKEMLEGLDVQKILEVGCNTGHNLVSLSKIGHYELVGIDPLEYAIKKGRASSDAISILKGNCFDLPFKSSWFDLVFTVGVLIHITREDLAKAIDEIYRVSNKYILAIEYWAPQETVIHYRGYDDLLWKRDFKKIFLQQKPNLKCIKEGLWSAKEGFEGCSWWLFEKQQKKIAAIVQARMTSTRLPGKVLMDIAGKPMIWWVVHRLSFSKKLDDIILAIPNNKENDILEKFAKENKIKYFRGSEEDVLKRYYEAAKKFQVDVIVRITGDCPLIDPGVVDIVVEKHLNSNADFTANFREGKKGVRIEATFPRGLDVEVFNFNVLEKAHREAKEPFQREHVDPYIFEHPEMFQIRTVKNSQDLSHLRWTVDEAEDLEVVREIYKMKSTNKIKIGDKLVGKGEPCFIIAEAGINHNGDIALAKKMIDVAKECGADAVKFQAFKADEFIADKKEVYTYKSQGKEVKESMYEMFKRYEFSEAQFKELFDYCQEKKIIFFATPQNISDAEMLLRIGVPLMKVGSDDLVNLPLIKKYASYALPIIISTGMASLGEIEEAVNTVRDTGNDKLILLHCVSSYPTQAEEVNLRKMQTIRQTFQVIVGFSDHTQGCVASLAAVAVGAKVIEKHFTLNHNFPGPDHWFSADPKELKELVAGIRYIEEALGSPLLAPTVKEREMRKLARRSIVAKEDIKASEQLTLEKIEYKKPGTGLLPKFTDLVIGRKAKQEIKKGDLITLEKLG